MSNNYFSNMKMRMFSNWNIMRIVRLLLGGVILTQAIANHDLWVGIMAALFMLMPIFNIGCCTSACNIKQPNRPNKSDDIVFEEIK